MLRYKQYFNCLVCESTLLNNILNIKLFSKGFNSYQHRPIQPIDQNSSRSKPIFYPNFLQIELKTISLLTPTGSSKMAPLDGHFKPQGYTEGCITTAKLVCYYRLIVNLGFVIFFFYRHVSLITSLLNRHYSVSEIKIYCKLIILGI